MHVSNIGTKRRVHVVKAKVWFPQGVSTNTKGVSSGCNLTANSVLAQPTSKRADVTVALT